MTPASLMMFACSFERLLCEAQLTAEKAMWLLSQREEYRGCDASFLDAGFLCLPVSQQGKETIVWAIAVMVTAGYRQHQLFSGRVLSCACCQGLQQLGCCTGSRIHTCVICRAQLCVCNTLLGQAGLCYCICLGTSVWLGTSVLAGLLIISASSGTFWSSCRDSMATPQVCYHGWNPPAAQH